MAEIGDRTYVKVGTRKKYDWLTELECLPADASLPAVAGTHETEYAALRQFVIENSYETLVDCDDYSDARPELSAFLIKTRNRFLFVEMSACLVGFFEEACETLER